MALRNIFKKKKKIETVKKPIEIEAEKPAVMAISKMKREGKIGLAHGILKAPQITEKATEATKQNQYTFKIMPKSNKAEVKKAIEDLYGVEVLGVKIIKVPRKRRRVSRISGFRPGYKKAIVKIKEGQKIEVLPR